MGYRDVERHSYPLPPQAMSVDDATLLLKDTYKLVIGRSQDNNIRGSNRRSEEGLLLLVAYWLIWLAPERAKSH
jgi:hypothetical protein